MRYCQACHRCFNDGVEFCLFDHTPTCEVERLPIVIESKYRLDQLIAHGGMGSVYRATHLQLERSVAIKILRAEYLADQKVIERFNREARAAARLKHPNIIAVYDYGLLPASGGAYLVMELVEGRSLREEMRTSAARHGQMRRERAVALMRQACAGVEAAHQRGIIHRDLKPDNIMIETEPNGGEVVKVLDFGIAKLKESEQPLQSLTDEGTFIGTPNYISPEQCTSLPVDARSDVYSLGVILYELLTGRVPFSGGGTSTVLLRHLQEPPAPPSRFRPDIGRALEQVVLRALAKSPSQRYASAAQFSDQLAAALRSETVESSDSVGTRERRQLPAVIPTPAKPRLIPVDLVPDRQPQPLQVRPVAREPHLLLESGSRTRLYLAVAAISLALLGILGYSWQQGPAGGPESLTASLGKANEQSGVRGSGPTVPKPVSESRLSANQAGELQPRMMVPTSAPALDPSAARTVGAVSAPSVPASLVAPTSSPVAATEAERSQRELQAVYAVWAATASRGEWKSHINFYADRVDYYRDGVIPRSAVEARKRRIFSGLDAFTLRFADTPRIYLRASGGESKADLVFDKQWVLSRGRRRAEGKARTLVTLRRDGPDWHIIGERQLQLYYSKTRMVKR